MALCVQNVEILLCNLEMKQYLGMVKQVFHKKNSSFISHLYLTQICQQESQFVSLVEKKKTAINEIL